MELIDKNLLLNTICKECPGKHYTVGFANELKCKSVCDITITINSQPSIKISNKKFKELQLKNK